MNLIFYDEAAKILGFSEDAVRHAAVRGDLTRVGTEGNRQRLIREQVMLFSGINPRTGKKKRISYNALTESEKALWQKYANEYARAGQLAAASLDEETVRRMVDEGIQKSFVDMVDAITTLIEGGVPQGPFFREAPDTWHHLLRASRDSVNSRRRHVLQPA